MYDWDFMMERIHLRQKAGTIYYDDKNKLDKFNKSLDNLEDIVNNDFHVDYSEIMAAFDNVINQCALMQSHLKDHKKKSKRFRKTWGAADFGKIALKALAVAVGIGSIGGVLALTIWGIIKAGAWGLLGLVSAAVLPYSEVIMLGLCSAAENLDGYCDSEYIFNEGDYARIIEIKNELTKIHNAELSPTT